MSSSSSSSSSSRPANQNKLYLAGALQSVAQRPALINTRQDLVTPRRVVGSEYAKLIAFENATQPKLTAIPQLTMAHLMVKPPAELNIPAPPPLIPRSATQDPVLSRRTEAAATGYRPPAAAQAIGMV